MSINVRIPTSSNSTTVRIGQTNATKALTSTRAGKLIDLTDIDIRNSQEVSVLVYNSETKKFTATNELSSGAEENLIINGGEF